MKQQDLKATRVNKTLASVAVALMSLFGVVDASAVCSQVGVIEYSTTGAANTTFYITAVTAVLPAFAYTYTAPAGTTFHAILSDAMVAGQVVSVTGDAAVCPAAGAFRFGGVVLSVRRFDQ
jgi:hypothetical protein